MILVCMRAKKWILRDKEAIYMVSNPESFEHLILKEEILSPTYHHHHSVVSKSNKYKSCNLHSRKPSIVIRKQSSKNDSQKPHLNHIRRQLSGPELPEEM